MRREDVRPLLAQAVDRVPEPDLADSAWAGGVTVRRRRRRTEILTVLAVILVLIVISIVIGATN
jgi:hypothetical protein